MESTSVIEIQNNIENSQADMEVETRVKSLTKNIAETLIMVEVLRIITGINKIRIAQGGMTAAITIIKIVIDHMAEEVTTTTEIIPIEDPTFMVDTTNVIIIKAGGEKIKSSSFEKLYVLKTVYKTTKFN